MNFGEMASRLQEPDGGFSVRPHTGFEPSSGFMVSQAGTERKHPAGEEVTGEHLAHYADAHSSFLGRRGSYMGGWHDPESGARDLDVSRRFTSHGRAQHSMVANDQDALYDLNQGHSERNWLGRGAPVGGQFQGRLPQGVSPMSPEGYQNLQKVARRHSR